MEYNGNSQIFENKSKIRSFIDLIVKFACNLRQHLKQFVQFFISIYLAKQVNPKPELTFRKPKFTLTNCTIWPCDEYSVSENPTLQIKEEEENIHSSKYKFRLSVTCFMMFLY